MKNAGGGPADVSLLFVNFVLSSYKFNETREPGKP